MTAHNITRPVPIRRRAPLLPALWQLILTDLRRMLRNPMFAVGTIGFPIIFFALFGLPLVHKFSASGVNAGRVILVQFGAYSLLSIAMFSFGAAVAVERTGGWLRLLRASPLPVPLYFLANIIAALIFSALGLSVLYAFAHFTGGVTLPLGLALTVLGKLLLAMTALIALGLCIGFLVNPQAAQITAQIISVVMAFASGLFTPLEELPKFVQQMAPYMPAYHMSQIATGTMAHHTNGEMTHWLALAAFTLVFGALAVWGMKRDESREG